MNLKHEPTEQACDRHLSSAALPGDQPFPEETATHLESCPECRSQAERWREVETRLQLPARATPSWEALKNRLCTDPSAKPIESPSHNVHLYKFMERLRAVLLPQGGQPWGTQLAFCLGLLLFVLVGVHAPDHTPQSDPDPKKVIMAASIRKIQDFGLRYGPEPRKESSR